MYLCIRVKNETVLHYWNTFSHFILAICWNMMLASGQRLGFLHAPQALPCCSHTWTALTCCRNTWSTLTCYTHTWPTLTCGTHTWPTLTCCTHTWPTLTCCTHTWPTLTYCTHTWPTLICCTHGLNWPVTHTHEVFYGQEPPSGESTTTECGVNYQLLAVVYWSSLMGNS